MSIKAVFSDLDGTLLNPEHSISDYSLRVLKRLKEETNVCFIVATGRPYGDVFPTLTKCNLEPDYIITSNGARIHDRNRQLVSKHNLDPALAKEIIKEAGELAVEQGMKAATSSEPQTDSRIPKSVNGRGFTINLYHEADWVTDKGIPEVAAAFHPNFQYKEIGDKMYHLEGDELDNIHEIYFLGDHENLTPLKERLTQLHGDRVALTFSLPIILDCVPITVNKGVAITEVCRRLNIAVSEVAAFGDGMNDEKMLAAAGHPFVMANANPLLVEALPNAVQIGSNGEGGVAKQIEKLFFQ